MRLWRRWEQDSHAAGRSLDARGARLACALGVAIVGLGAVAGLYLRDDFLFMVRFQALGKNPQGFREYRHRRTGIVFVRLPGGAAFLGTSDDERAVLVSQVLAQTGGTNLRGANSQFSEEKPKDLCVVRPFLIAKYELTQGAWRRIMGEAGDESLDDAALPLASASWDDCRAFCDVTGLRFPTEAEWECACRGGNDDSDPTAELDRVDAEAWYRGNSGGDFHRGGLKAPNGFGLFDMKGNAWEMCGDDYDDNGRNRPARGGSRASSPWQCRCGARVGVLSGFGKSDVGFRPAYSAP